MRRFPPPETSPLKDKDVALRGARLAGRRIALVVTGGIAALRTPLLARTLRRYGAEVTAYVSTEGLRYVARDALAWATDRAVVTELSADAEHLEDRVPFDAYLVAPATYNTLNKLRHGIADGPALALLASGLGRMGRGEAQVLVCPTMHGTMHNALLEASLEALADLGVRVVPLRQEDGKDKLPDDELIVAEVCRALSASPLRGRRILVTGGPTPVEIDAVRRITTKFTGALAIELATALHLRGAEPELLLGPGGVAPPPHLRTTPFATYDAYVAAVDRAADDPALWAGIFSAAVADYRPERVLPGKTPSGAELLELRLRPTEKVIERVRARRKDLRMVTFKYEEGVTHEELIATARTRLERFEAVVANRGEERGPAGEQVAHLVARDAAFGGASGYAIERLVGKPGIAEGVARLLERLSREPG